jgi:membrane protein implicated in regulation of membrane protease activity
MDWFTALSGLEKAYVISAGIGGAVLMVQLLLTLLGGAELDTDMDIDVDMDLDIDHGSDLSFQWFSIQSMSGFFMMFGLAGMTLVKEFGRDKMESFVGALACGLLTGWVIYKMFQGMKKLETSGNIDMNNAIGQIGRVYMTIEPSEGGRVEIVVQDKLAVFDAVSETKEKINTGEQVKVISLINNKVLSVVIV